MTAVEKSPMQRLLLLAAALLALTLAGCPVMAQDATPAMGVCDAPTRTPGTPAPQAAVPGREAGSATLETPAPAGTTPGDAAGPEATARVIAGITNFVACRNAGDYAAYAALLTPARIWAEAGSTNPHDVVAGLQAFNLPITIISLGDVRTYPDGRLSAEFVHLFGRHLYYRSRIYVVEEGGFIKFDEEQFLPERPPGEMSAVEVELTDFAFVLSQDVITNASYVVLRGTNTGAYAHEIIVVRLPEGATVEQALMGAISEEQITFIGQTPLAPGQSDDLVLVNLEPGLYTLLCLTAEPDGIPHAALGMTAQFVVDGAAPLNP